MSDKKKCAKESSPPKKGGIGCVIFVLLMICACIAALLYVPQARKFITEYLPIPGVSETVKNYLPQTSEKTRSADGSIMLKNNLAAIFEELEARESEYAINDYPKDSSIKITAQIPRGRPIEWIVWKLSGAARGTPFSVEDCVCASVKNCTVTFKNDRADHPYQHVSLNIEQTGRYFSNTAKMAILVENFGFEANQTTMEYLSFPEPLTISLVPARKHAEWTARIADEYKKEIVLSLPMEPLPAQFSDYAKSMVKLHHGEAEIRAIIAQAIAAVPNLSGVGNFHGGRVMEDSRVMEIILSEVNKRKVYFVYTDISRKSVAPQLTRQMKVSSVQIQRTIDASHTVDQVRERMTRFSMEAQNNGRVIIKAQPTPAFIKVLKEEAETLRGNGIRLVYVSELLDNR